MTKNKLSYVTDTSEAACNPEYSWCNSVYSKRALCPRVHQKNKCFSHGLAVAEASRGVINLQNDLDIPKLSAMEALNYCRVDFSKGQYSAALGLEWVVREGLTEDSGTGTRHFISEWEHVPEYEPDIKCAVIRQPIIVSLQCPSSLFEDYEGGLIDAHEMQTSETCYAHTMLLIGFGFYFFPDKSVVNYWELKNYVGEESAENEYIYIKRNSSLSSDKWVKLNPLAPLCFLQGEEYIGQHIVEDMTFQELGKIWRNLSFHVIILFYDYGCMDRIQVSKDFVRSSRFYLTKEDVRFVQVDATNNWDACSRYGVSYQGTPVLRIYKYEEKSGCKTIEGLRHDGFILAQPKIDFQTMIGFIFEKLSGILV